MNGIWILTSLMSPSWIREVWNTLLEHSNSIFKLRKMQNHSIKPRRWASILQCCILISIYFTVFTYMSNMEPNLPSHSITSTTKASSSPSDPLWIQKLTFSLHKTPFTQQRNKPKHVFTIYTRVNIHSYLCYSSSAKPTKSTEEGKTN